MLVYEWTARHDYLKTFNNSLKENIREIVIKVLKLGNINPNSKPLHSTL